MLSREVAQRVLGRCLITGGDFAEIFEEDTINNTIGILNGKVENSVGGRSYGIGIRIFKGLKAYMLIQITIVYHHYLMLLIKQH